MESESLERAWSRYSRFIFFTLIYLIAVIAWGAIVRATGSGAGCGDHWPLCNGEVFPTDPLVKTWIEFTHRLTSGLSLIAVVIAYVWSRRISHPQSRVRSAAFISLIAIFLEAALGAGLVILKHVEMNQSVGRAISISLHQVNTLFLLACVASLLFFSFDRRSFAQDTRDEPWLSQNRSFWLGVALFIGVGMSGAIVALGDTLFPGESLLTELQKDFDPTAHFLIRLRWIHPLLAIGWILAALNYARCLEPDPAVISPWKRALVSLLAIQFCLGILNWVLMAPHWLQVVHLIFADGLFIVFWMSSLKRQHA